MAAPERIDYVEFPARDLNATKAFFSRVFGWEFEDHGPDYCSFQAPGLKGGFFRSRLHSHTEQGGALLVLHSPDLEASESRVVQAGGLITQPIFAFPGGRRFHFTEPSGNELGVWSENPPHH